MKRFLLFALVATMFAACVTDATEDVAVGVETPETLTVSFEGDSRIQLQNGKTVWNAGDLVSVFYLSNANQKWQYQGKTGDRTGNLKRVSNAEATQELSNVVIVYPYNENYYINPRTCNVRATLPATQHYLKDSYGLDGNILISASEYNQFSLKNVCGWLKVQLKGEGQVVKTITVKGNNGEQVAGQIYINSTDATATLAAEMGTADEEENGTGGTLVFDDTIINEVTLDCGEGVTLGSEATAFYIALPPQTFEKGLTMNVAYSDGTKMSKSTSNALTIVRNTVQPMETLYYDGNLPPVYEIAYTTNDGQPLDPYTTEGFGSNFVENIYDATTGKGALKFDGTITTIPEKAFIACTNLTNIELPLGITAINAEAFNGCSALLVMNIPQGVKSIGNKAFNNCGAVTEITIPDSVTTIGTSSFEGCGGKATINCKIANASSSASSSGKFYKAKFTDIVIGDNITSIGSSAFCSCTSLTSITIPDSVTSIGSYAFRNCTSLTSVTIPESVTSIGDYTFYYCTSLTSVTIPDSVTRIGNFAFEDCTSLTSVTIPDSVTSIGSRAFQDCTSLTSVYYEGDLSAWCKISFGESPLGYGAKLYLNGVEATDITIPSDITEIKDYTFYYCTSLTSVTIGNRVTSIGEYAFRNCTSLTSVTIPDSVTSIGKNAFSGCKSLTSVIIGNGVLSVGDYAFNSCTSLTSVTIPDSVTSIGSSAFEGCTSLTSVTIPNGVTSIRFHAFYNCTSLKEVYCKPTTPPTGEYYMFSYNSNGYKPIGCTIYVPAASVEAYKSASYWSDYKLYIVGYDF